MVDKDGVVSQGNEGSSSEKPKIPPLKNINPAEVTKLAGIGDKEFTDYIKTHKVSRIGDDPELQSHVLSSGVKFDYTPTDNDFEVEFWNSVKFHGINFNPESIIFKMPLDQMLDYIYDNHNKHQELSKSYWKMIDEGKVYESDAPFFLCDQSDLEIKRLIELFKKEEGKVTFPIDQKVISLITHYVNAMPMGPSPDQYIKDGILDQESFDSAKKEFRDKHENMSYRESVMPDIYRLSDSTGDLPRKLHTIILDNAKQQKINGHMFIPRKNAEGAPIYDEVSGKQIHDIIIFKNGIPVRYHIMHPESACAISQESLDSILNLGMANAESNPEENFIAAEYISDPEKLKSYLEAIRAKHQDEADKRIFGEDSLIDLELELDINAIKKGKLEVDGKDGDYGVNLDDARQRAIDAKGNLLVKVPKRDKNKNPILDKAGKPIHDLLVLDKNGKIVGGLIQKPASQTLIKEKDREELKGVLKKHYKGREAELATAMGLTPEAKAKRKESLGVDYEGPDLSKAELKPSNKEPKKENIVAAEKNPELEDILKKERAAAQAEKAAAGREASQASGNNKLNLQENKRADEVKAQPKTAEMPIAHQSTPATEPKPAVQERVSSSSDSSATDRNASAKAEPKVNETLQSPSPESTEVQQNPADVNRQAEQNRASPEQQSDSFRELERQRRETRAAIQEREAGRKEEAPAPTQSDVGNQQKVFGDKATTVVEGRPVERKLDPKITAPANQAAEAAQTTPQPKAAKATRKSKKNLGKEAERVAPNTGEKVKKNKVSIGQSR